MKKKTICPLDCPDSCGLVASVAGGRVTGLAGDPDHPYTRGVICRKMRRFPERLYGPDRVLYPQVRVGVKGSGSFCRITWDEAFAILVDRLGGIVREHGGEALLPFSYAGNMGMVNRFAGYPLFHKLGASQLDQTICFAAAGEGWARHCGDVPGCPPEKAGEAELILAWGINVRVSNIHFWPYIVAAKKRGGRLVVIDPYRNQTAKLAEVYLPVKPGGDAALALGLLKALVAGELLDHAVLDRQSQGYTTIAEYVGHLSWPAVEAESGLSRAVMTELAAMLAATPKTFIRIGIGLTRNSRGGMAVRAITSLAAALGLFTGGPGRGVLLSAGAFRGNRAVLTHPELAPAATRTINMIHLGRALCSLAPPVKALFVYNANPLSVCPDASQVRRGLLREDLFTVVHEQVMTPTARYADLLLPATTFLENRDLYGAYGHFFLRVAEPVIAPYGEAMSNFDLFQELARRLGFIDPPFHESAEKRIAAYLRGLAGLPEGSDMSRILAGDLILSTFSREAAMAGRKFPFVVPVVASEPPFACLTRSGESADPDLLARYPLHLITPPHPDLLNSTFGDLHQGTLGEVLIHPDDAAVWQVAEGEEVILENGRGRCPRRARVTGDTRPGLLVAEGLFWPIAEDDWGINELTSQKCGDMGGGATFHESLVRLAGKNPSGRPPLR